ncbi:glyoxalase superfamily protein [Herbaspirillum robiniae]|uniref:glyoxalase superfamily protein n=1 Tax=Herbaspirillum robiniae TaxID=2014887 RepID=UPI0009A1A56B|nr:glyoxalase superfamily protein [Herbaspirillum robiniae]
MTKTFTKARIEQLSLQAQRLYRESKSTGNKINQRKSYDLIAQKEGFSSWALLMKHARQGNDAARTPSLKGAHDSERRDVLIRALARVSVDIPLAGIENIKRHRMFFMTLYYLPMRVGETAVLRTLPESSGGHHGS